MKKDLVRINYELLIKIELESDLNIGRSRLCACNLEFSPGKNIRMEGWTKESGQFNKDGLKAQTQAMVQGLVANIFAGHEDKEWDSAEHLRYIIKNLENGFAKANYKISHYQPMNHE